MVAGDYLFPHVTRYAYGLHDRLRASTSRLTFPGADSPVLLSVPLHPATGSSRIPSLPTPSQPLLQLLAILLHLFLSLHIPHIHSLLS